MTTISNMMRRRASFLAEKSKLHKAEIVTYQRGSDSVQVYAEIGSTDYTIENVEGFSLGGEIVDFLIEADDLILNSVTVLPEFGDRITVTGRGVYEVAKLPTDGEYRHSDTYGYRLRIHTKFTEPS